MREYLFRGKTKETHEWVYGGYAVIDNRHFIIKEITYECGTNSWGAFEVDPNTVGQYIEHDDRKNTHIFEDDIVYIESSDEYAQIAWDGATSRFIILFDNAWYADFNNFNGKELDVVGNIFDEG